eukprot:5367033-Pyramimonas_sp.AAC.2
MDTHGRMDVRAQAAKFKPCYSILVMVYFLYNLARRHDFAVDFAHPIDQRLASYLQSPECIDALARGGALQVPPQCPPPPNINLHLQHLTSTSDSSTYTTKNPSILQYNIITLLHFTGPPVPIMAR